MAAIAIKFSKISGTAITTAAATAGGDTMVNDGKTILYVTNGGGVNPCVVTIPKYADYCNQGSVHSTGNSVAIGTTKVFGPFIPAQYNIGGNNYISIAYDQVTSVTVAAISIE